MVFFCTAVGPLERSLIDACQSRYTTRSSGTRTLCNFELGNAADDAGEQTLGLERATTDAEQPTPTRHNWVRDVDKRTVH